MGEPRATARAEPALSLPRCRPNQHGATRARTGTRDSWPRIVETDPRARQGPKGRPVLMVLIGAFALIAALPPLDAVLGGLDLARQHQPGCLAHRRHGLADRLGEPTARTPPANPAYPVRNDMTTGSTTPSGTTDDSLRSAEEAIAA